MLNVFEDGRHGDRVRVLSADELASLAPEVAPRYADLYAASQENIAAQAAEVAAREALKAVASSMVQARERLVRMRPARSFLDEWKATIQAQAKSGY